MFIFPFNWKIMSLCQTIYAMVVALYKCKSICGGQILKFWTKIKSMAFLSTKRTWCFTLLLLMLLFWCLLYVLICWTNLWGIVRFFCNICWNLFPIINAPCVGIIPGELAVITIKNCFSPWVVNSPNGPQTVCIKNYCMWVHRETYTWRQILQTVTRNP